MKKTLLILAVLLGLNLCAKSQATLTGPYINFPDSMFLKALIKKGVDANKDGKIDTTEAQVITILDVSGTFSINGNITDFMGIEYFKNLEILNCVYNQLSSLDISKNINLKSLNCSFNQLTSLDVSKNIYLTDLKCYSNKLTSLDVSKNIIISDLFCDNNQLTSLDVSKNVKLNNLFCGINKLSTLDVSKNVNLTNLGCYSNSITSLDVSKNVNLTNLGCYNNSITSLDVSKNVNLTQIRIGYNNIKNIDVSKNINLTDLDCRNDSISNLYISKNIKLKSLYCNNNLLNILDVSKNINLTVLNCSNVSISSLDISKNIKLTYLFCDNNKLNCLNTNENINLTLLWCGHNQFSNLDISKCRKLTELRIENNPNLQQVCVWTLPFPPKSITKFADYGCSKNLRYTFCKGDIPYNNEVKGTVYYDVNKNNKKDSTEYLADNIKMILLPDSFYVNSINGDFKFMIGTGNFYFHPLVNPLVFKTVPALDSVNYISQNQFDTTHNFALQPIKDTALFNIDVTNVNFARPGFPFNFDINLRNEGTVNFVNGSVDMQYDTTLMTFVGSTPNEDIIDLDTLTWNFKKLLPSQKNVIKANFIVSTKIPHGTLIKIVYCVRADTTHNKMIAPPFQKCDTFIVLVKGSWDPNDKAVSPDGSLNVIPINTQELTYTIRFQNTGTDTAFNVYIKDTLSKNLNPSTFNIVAASHANHYQLEKNILTVFFDNILLADSNTNEPMSHGYVKYKISPINIKEGTVIDNTAYIYFDFNDPVKTNTAKSILKTSTGVISEKYVFTNNIVYPNPATTELKINVGSYQDTPVSYKIYDIMGKEITNGLTRRLSNDNISTGSMTVDISKLTKGIYIIELTTKEGVVRSKFIKE